MGRPDAVHASLEHALECARFGRQGMKDNASKSSVILVRQECLPVI